MVYCQKCGTENTNDAQFCQECGSALIVKSAVDAALLEKDKKHIVRQIKLLSVFLIFIALFSLIIGMGALSSGNIIVGAIEITGALIFVIMPIILILKKTPKIMLITGILALVLGIGSLLPMLVGIALLYYYPKYKKILEKIETEDIA